MEGLSYVDVHPKSLMVTNKRVYGVLKSAIDIMYANFNSSAFSTSSYNVTVNVPADCVLYNRVYQTITWQLTLTGTASLGPNLLPVDANGDPIHWGFRSFALDNATKSLQVQFQNLNLTENVNSYASATFPHFSLESDLQRSDEAGQPLMPDSAQDYSLSDNTPIDPLAPYYDNSYWNTRGSYPVTIVSNTPTSAVIQVTMTSPLKCSPLAHGRNQTFAGIIGINQLQVQCNWDTNLVARLFSASPSVLITGSSVSCVSAGVNVGFFTPRPELRMMYPSRLDLPYYQTINYITSVPSTVSGGVGQVTTQNVELNSVPNCVFVWIARQDSDKTIFTTDTFFELQQITITYNGKTGILSSATEFSLYELSENNNFNHTFREWQAVNGFGCGSILKLVFGTDIPLGDGIAPGMPIRSNIQMTINYKNQSLDTIIPQCVLLFVNEGVVSIQDGYASASVGVVTESAYQMSEPSMLTFERNKSVLGAGFFDSLKSKVGQAFGFAKDFVQSGKARQVLEGAKSGLKTGKQLVDRFGHYIGIQKGALDPYASGAEDLLGDAGEALGQFGGGMTGGRRLPRRRLKR